MAVTTAEEFFAVLQKSKLLTPAQLAQAHLVAQGSDDPTTIAKRLARRELITRWQAGQLLAGRSSFYLGKYQLIELLGQGGLGNVFLGRHVTMNRRVALKIISREVGKDPASLDRFLAEARAVAALDHPNIVQAYSVDNEGDRYYMVMEYVDGLDLQRMVEEEGPLECRLAADYIRQAAEGLDHAHQLNMIHCGVKPSSLLVNVQGVVKILDMGLARLTHGPLAAEHPSEPDPAAGDYRAPEQLRPEAKLDCRVDVYSLGCTLFFLLTGRPPYTAGMKRAHPPPSVRAERPNVPADLDAICARMMAPRPEDRFASAAEAGQALAQWRPKTPPPRGGVLSKTKSKDAEENGDFLGINLAEAYSAQRASAELKHPAAGRRGLGGLPARLLALFFSTPGRAAATIAVALLAALIAAAMYLQ
jgi:serine/threonine protein kinase